MKKVFILLIQFYQKCISPLKPACCKYYPSCSGYAIEAFKKHGLIKGLLLSGWRLLRCNPWSPGGLDYVPERFYFVPFKGGNREKNSEKSPEKS